MASAIPHDRAAHHASQNSDPRVEASRRTYPNRDDAGRYLSDDSGERDTKTRPPRPDLNDRQNGWQNGPRVEYENDDRRRDTWRGPDRDQPTA